jgi:hypothetical protein
VSWKVSLREAAIKLVLYKSVEMLCYFIRFHSTYFISFKSLTRTVCLNIITNVIKSNAFKKKEL